MFEEYEAMKTIQILIGMPPHEQDGVFGPKTYEALLNKLKEIILQVTVSL